MKKILFITSGLFPVPCTKGGSIESLVTNLININEKEKMFYFTVSSCFDEDAFKQSKQYKNTNFIYYKYNHTFNFSYKIWVTIYYIARAMKINLPKYRYIWQIYQIIKSQNFDFIIVEEGDPWAFNFLSAKVGKEKMIYHSHSEMIPKQLNHHFTDIYSYTISVSDHIKKHNFKHLINSEIKSYVLLNSINEALFYKNCSNEIKENLKNKLQIQNSDIIYLYVGRISVDKGILELIKAWKLSNLSHAKLLIIGSALLNHSTLTEYEKSVKKELENSNNILLLGYIPQDELYQYHQISDISISPCMHEGAGLMNIEAMYSGLPIISTTSGGIPEYVINNRNGILINDKSDIISLSDAIKKLYNDKSLRNYFRNNNLIDRNQFSMINYYKNFVNIIDTISNQNNF